MDRLQTFLAMGGYGGFVWPAFVLTALVLIWLLVTSLRRLRALERALAEAKIAPPGSGGGIRGGAEKAP